MQRENQISNSFAQSFLSRSLQHEIDMCDSYELAPLFLKLFHENQPVLEAGCGSGRWCAWFAKNNIQSDGIDWSQELCNRAKQNIPNSNFFACDMSDTKLDGDSYGGLIALGSVEHSSVGPLPALKEFYRILKPKGYAIITVPYGGWLRRTLLLIRQPILYIKSRNFIRRLFNKPTGISLKDAKKETNKRWCPIFIVGQNGYTFYEYEFNKIQMRSFLKDAKLSIVEEFVAFGDEGILHNFGSIVGKWDNVKYCVGFNFFGKLLRKAIPVSVMGHMLCYIVQKN